MRKRAELKAATTNLEKPWERPAQAPTLFVVAADQQLQALADRFQKPVGIDLWTNKDGPQSTYVDGQPSVYSTTPYTSVVRSVDSGDARSSGSQQVSGSTPTRKRYDFPSSYQQQSERNSTMTSRIRNDNNTRKSVDFPARHKKKSLVGSNLLKDDDSWTADTVFGIGSISRHSKKRDSDSRLGKYSQNLQDSNARPRKYSRNPRDYAENRRISSNNVRGPTKTKTLHSDDANTSEKRGDHAFVSFNFGKRSEQRLRWKHS